MLENIKNLNLLAYNSKNKNTCIEINPAWLEHQFLVITI